MTTHTDGQPHTTGILWWVGRVAAWFVIFGIGVGLAVAVLIPRIGGATPYAILTGSMKPGMPPGTLVVVRPVKAEDIAIGDVVTYQLASGKPTVVTHRVVAIGVNAKGERTFTTQGDANNVVDQKPVRAAQIRGERWYSVPRLGFVNEYVSGEQRHITTLVVVSALLAYAASMLAGGLRDRRRDRGRTPVPPRERVVW
jgi:signal peptidase